MACFLAVPGAGQGTLRWRGGAMKTPVVTGGGRGLGRVTAGKFARAGHRVVLIARTQAAAEVAAAEIRAGNAVASVEPRAVDLASLASVRAFAPVIVDDLGRIEVLFNIAGVLQTSPSRRVTAEGFEETLAVNALAPFLLTRLLLPALERSDVGRVVNVSSRLHLPGSRGKPVGFALQAQCVAGHRAASSGPSLCQRRHDGPPAPSRLGTLTVRPLPLSAL